MAQLTPALPFLHYWSTALPPLDWPLPSQFDQYELRIEVQPRPHHRAHYETEGSRGAVKASPTGHPVVKLCGFSERKPLSLQVFVGTADDRSIRPHPFYQIHRVTGKMVGTASHESVQAGTKLLDIPLNPENNMIALIDCAGILKLRNSDIELRKGETDVGRKNTRVRLVFRIHLPVAPPVAPPGRVLALQVASVPIECSQRSAQELPVIESVSLTSCSVEGGEELLLSGANFLPISRVLFMERGAGTYDTFTCTYLYLPAPTCTYLYLPVLTCTYLPFFARKKKDK
uniref:Nuclear factor of activated T-cells, cytoplasmic 4-like n=1 Tax=Gouania willdenowi TaxID=441366 RepID=A0A8C5GDW4_GOUWI